MSVDDVARRSMRKQSLALVSIESRISTLEKRIQTLAALYDD